MPSWDYIEDAAPKAPRIWLSRLLSSSEQLKTEDGTTSHYFPPSTAEEKCIYQPLRKVDCKAINERFDMLDAAGVPTDEFSTQLGTILLESGRVTADLHTRRSYYNFYNGAKRAILGAAWFTRMERDGDVVLHPLSEIDGEKVEQLYQRAVEASSSLSDVSLDDVLKEYIDLEDERGFKVIIVKVGRTLTMKKKSTSLFGPSFNLQRGYGEYSVPGEDDEVCLAPPRHLFFVIHGIGEAMWSRDDCSVPGVIASTDQARDGMNRKLAEAWRAECKRCEKAGEAHPSPPHRIELIPLEWYSKIHSKQSVLKNTLLTTTLDSIPRLRAIANDVVFDVLTYLTPSFCQDVLECVTSEIIRSYDRFNQVHPTFLPAGGKTSIIGHSLGSVIVWDLLSILADKQNNRPTYKPGHSEAIQVGSIPQNAGHSGPLLSREIDMHLPFEPECTLFLGSPLGLFLSLRGCHEVFDELRKSESGDIDGATTCKSAKSTGGIDESLSSMVSEPESIATKVSPFVLPTKELFNIFHPADVVAYRIEPLLVTPGTPNNLIPPPAYLTANKGVRLHIQLQEATKNLSRSVSGLLGGLNVGNAVVAAAASMGQEAERRLSSRRSSTANNTKDQEEIKFPLGGRNARVDFKLQTGIVENEYLSAVTAHGCYFTNDDLLQFLIELSSKVALSSERMDDAVDADGWERKNSSAPGEVAFA